MTISATHAGNRGIHSIHACFNCFKQSHIGKASGGVAVQMQLDIHLFFQGRHQLFSGIRGQNAGHIFQGN
ncbi:Uncharacterised protein [Vibrio cholerae]|nr:Uncharacterised protein [Vibrio cholerae]CSI21254.1 Uncharacterised protein [Vibrio cholerae]